MLLNKSVLAVVRVALSDAAPHYVLWGPISLDATRTFATEFVTEYTHFLIVWSLL